TAHRTAQSVLDHQMAYGPGPVRAVGYHSVDRRITDLLKKARLKVCLESRRIEGVDQLLGRRVRDDANLVRQRCAKRSEGLQEPFPCLQWPIVADANARDRRTIRQGNTDRSRG